MRLFYPFAVVLLVSWSAVYADDDEEDDISHGFGDLNWVSWENARELGKMQRKPILLLIHKSWCGACKALKSKFQQKTAIAELKKLAKHFVMTNTEDDEEPWEEEFQPDGKYIPRIIFMDPEGNTLDVVNDKAEYAGYQYYYTNPAQVMTSMRKVMKMFNIGGEEKQTDTKKKDEKVEKKKEKETKTEEPEPPAESEKQKEDEEPKPPSTKPPAKEDL